MTNRHKPTRHAEPRGGKAPNSFDGADTRKVPRVFGGVFLLLVLLRFVAAFFPKERLWGLNHLAYLPMWLNVLLTAIALFCCTPLAAWLVKRLATRLHHFYSWLAGKSSRTLLYLFLSLGFGFLCWSFPIQFPFLGDGPQYLLNVARVLVGDETSRNIFFAEPFTGLTYLGIGKLLPATTDVGMAYEQVQLIYRIAAAVMGGIFFSLALVVAHQWARQISGKVITILTLLACAGTLFFFGYIEYYTFVYVGIGFYCCTALAYYEGRVSIFVPIVAFLLSVGFHFLAAVLLPSLVYLVLSHWSTTVRQLTLRRALTFIGISAIVLFVVYLLIEPLPRVRDFFIPLLRDGEQTYSLLSPYRMADLVNEQLLLSQAGLVFLGVSAILLRKRIEWNKPQVIFLLFATAYIVMMNLSGQTLFGMGIDWDIFAVVGLVYTLSAVYLIVPVIQRSQWGWNVTSMVIGSVLMSSVPWIMANVPSDVAVERFKNLVDLNAAHLKVWNMEYRYETLRKYYQHQGREAEEFETIQKLIACTHGDPTEYEKLDTFVGDKGFAKYREPFLRAVDSLSHAVEKSKRSMSPTVDGSALSSEQRVLYDVYARFLIVGAVAYNLDVHRQAEQFKATFPLLPQGYELLGWCYLLKNDCASAMENLRQSYAMDTLRINTLMGLGKTYFMLAKDTEGEELRTRASNAIYFYEKALELGQPWTFIYGDMGYLYLTFGERAKARESFEQYLRVDSTSTYAQRIKAEWSSLQGSGQ